MYYLESDSNDAFYNMALEEYVFEALPRGQEYFMLWQNANAVVVGKYQNTLEELDAAKVREMDIQVVRRLSGGGAMYQDMGNLNFTFVVDQRQAKSIDFTGFIQPVVRALARLGVKAEQNGRNDIVIDGKKFSGNSQYNKGGRTMHHGTLLFSSSLETVGKVLKPRAEKIESKGVKSVRSRVTNIADYLPEALTMEDFKRALLKEMFKAAPLERLELTVEQQEQVKQLSQSKYATWEWNWGKSPACNVKKQRRYPFGGVELSMQVEKGTLRRVSISGDFFGNGNLEQLEKMLEGLPLEAAAIAQALGPVKVEGYIHGMEADALAALMLY